MGKSKSVSISTPPSLVCYDAKQAVLSQEHTQAKAKCDLISILFLRCLNPNTKNLYLFLECLLIFLSFRLRKLQLPHPRLHLESNLLIRPRPRRSTKSPRERHPAQAAAPPLQALPTRSQLRSSPREPELDQRLCQVWQICLQEQVQEDFREGHRPSQEIQGRGFLFLRFLLLWGWGCQGQEGCSS